MKFKTMTLQDGNYVIRQGEEINRLYIVGKGSLEVLSDGNLIQYLSMYQKTLKIHPQNFLITKKLLFYFQF